MGNDLALTDVTYAKALQRAQQLEARMSQAGPEERLKEKAWFRAIRRDIKTAFPELKIFQPGGPLHDGLLEVLMAYSMYRSDVGYSHGTHVSPAPSFWLFFYFRRGIQLTTEIADRRPPVPHHAQSFQHLSDPRQPPEPASPHGFSHRRSVLDSKDL